MTTSQSPCVILHIPHASTEIPSELRDQFILSDIELSLELDRLTDHYTDELFASANSDVGVHYFPVSRFVVDPERFEDDAQEPMAARGQGVVYTGTTSGHPLRRLLDSDERTSLLERYYIPHHKSLTVATELALAENGFITIIDAHSFPATPLSVDLSQSVPRPDICLGTDNMHTPTELVEIVRHHFVSDGYSVKINNPYAGTMVPLQYYGTDARVNSIMIEINRKLYLDGEPGNLTKNEHFETLQKTLQSIIESVTSWTRSNNHITH